MRAIRVASAALLGLGALALTAPAAVAKSDAAGITPFGFAVVPSTVAAGGQVALQVDRDHGGCRGSVTVSSGVFDTVTIAPRRSSATATVDWDARPGAVYQVTFTCDGVSGSTGLTISGGRPTPEPLGPTVPRGVHAGEGGSAGGFDAGEIGLGVALIAGAAGTAYFFARRRGDVGGVNGG
ncbi:hypothetical protein C3489_16425 [Streptomyces sp. Ru71]|uniref:hypothetical protein n=1 Tax=Streptomyces sp. Ru71 TaxID=2080746 RepID=UPI000CDDD351|nr:hypothetical protein [Streptomyces sp. Ru71]POX53120.1 hypothetical protein C3489_16425 [Streptomyces sp. Ru71]